MKARHVKRKRYFFGLGLAFGLLGSQASGRAAVPYTYRIENGAVTLTAYTGPGGAVSIPSSIEGLPVIAIGEWAFGYNTNVTSVTIPSTVTTIRRAAFLGCSGLASVRIPDSVTRLGDISFYRCTSLTSVEIPRSVAVIGYGAFNYCTRLPTITVDALNPSFKSVEGVLFNKSQTALLQFPGAKSGSYAVPAGVLAIENEAFARCGSLTSVVIPASVAAIGDWAFCACEKLVTITVDALNPFYSSAGGALFNKNQTILIQSPGAKTGSYVIPTSVAAIGNGAFYSSTGLTSIAISASVSKLGDSAFAGCTGLTSITIPDRITAITRGAFAGCAGLTNITIPNSVTSLRDSAFSGCLSLARVVIPDSVTSIGKAAFSACTGLTNVTLGNRVATLGESAFSHCYSLTGVAIPSSVTTIGSGAFWNCTNLTGVCFEGNAPAVGLVMFLNAPSVTVYCLPGTIGWGTTFGDRPTAAWVRPSPVILTGTPGFGVQTDGFGFTISWATNLSVVVEACADLTNPTWSSVATNTLTEGSSYFSDPEWTYHSHRFYRVRPQ